MKALVLAAGFGTRLAPYSKALPKPLFTLNNRTVLDLAVDNLVRAGCSRIFINTHHLAEKIASHVARHPQGEKITLVHEPKILDTGGAIANLEKELSDRDFLVVNADIVHDLDLAPVIDQHRSSGALATLVLHDHPQFNKISTGPDKEILGFDAPPDKGLAFTGIQVVSPDIFRFLPDKKVFSSIDLYRSLIPGKKIRAFLANGFYWNDMGTVDAYARTARQFLCGKFFAIPPGQFNELEILPIAGDGSDRKWFRASFRDKTLVLSDHGICLDGSESRAQLDAFVNIGTHLKRSGVNVPAVPEHERVSGLAAVEDLGGTHLADLVRDAPQTEVITLYRKVIDGLIDFSCKGIKEFNLEWTCQTPSYSKEMVLQYECRYFLEAFVKGYCNRDWSWEELEPSFSHIAAKATAEGITGLMHRDCQSRNIMVREDRIFFIDFQSARQGPLEYDLASLLIDPYVTLGKAVREDLFDYAIDRLAAAPGFDREFFCSRYYFCCIARNLQMLGAFGFLSKVKHKPWFESYIPIALDGLKKRLAPLENGPAAPLVNRINTL